MHSWGGYKLVKVLLNFGLSPKIHADLKDWSPDLYYLFIYLGAKQRDMSKKERADELLSILFDKTLHNSYFGKLSFGSREKFAKMANTTITIAIGYINVVTQAFVFLLPIFADKLCMWNILPPLMNWSMAIAKAETEMLAVAEKLVATTSWWQTGAANNHLNMARAIATATVTVTARSVTMTAAETEASAAAEKLMVATATVMAKKQRRQRKQW